MKKRARINFNEVTVENLEASGLWKISKMDFNTTYAKYLSKNQERIKKYKKYIIDDFNKTQELAVFLENLKTLAKAEGIANLAKKSSMKRNNIYRFLSKKNNPTFANLLAITHNLGMDFRLSVASR
ncbi:MAG: hypothetical protein LBJ98_03400 [Endomicrobium sp.]|jgi:probable addiction module antidote protein|nr:hypothetical protein [Endomicrobium sp.]